MSDLFRKNIDKKYFDVRVMLPKYTCIKQELKDKMKYKTHFYMDFNWKSEYVGVLEAKVDGITYYFIDNESYFSGFKIYSDNVLMRSVSSASSVRQHYPLCL